MEGQKASMGIPSLRHNSRVVMTMESVVPSTSRSMYFSGQLPRSSSLSTAIRFTRPGW